MEKKYWKSIGEIRPSNSQQADHHKEPDKGPTSIDLLSHTTDTMPASRRDFLKWCGISFVSATVLSACENPVKKAIPYLNQPEVLIPGKASWYASTYINGNEYCPILVKSRDGRPVKIEGNTLSSITGGGTSARVQASLLSLYDSTARYQSALKNGEPISWEQADREILQGLMRPASNGKRKVLLTPTLLSPTTKALINEAMDRIPGLEKVTWDAISYAAIRQAHQVTSGMAAIPGYRFDAADLVVSFGADFLGTWLSPVEFARAWSTKRKPGNDAPMSRHIQFESRLSLTGANADERVPVKPSDEQKILMALYDEVASATGNPTLGAEAVGYDVRTLAADILRQRGKTLVVCGHDHIDMQLLVNGINHMAGSYGTTIDDGRSLHVGMGDEQAFEQLVRDMQAGNVEAILFYKTNPLYHSPDPEGFLQGLKNTPLSISFASTKDETARECTYVLPDHHYLESWNDAEFKAGYFSLAQPLIHPLFKTRQFQDTLLAWTAREEDFHTYLQGHWSRHIFPQQSFHQGFDSFWVEALQSGIHENPNLGAIQLGWNGTGMEEAFGRLQMASRAAGDLEFCLSPNIALGDGSDANNPWLQELPDPVSSVTWDNFAALSPRQAEGLGLQEGDMLRINDRMEVPVLIQPGQAHGCIAIALGYGRTHAGISADNRGGNAFLLSRIDGQGRHFTGKVESWAKSGGEHLFARTQTHFSMEGRAIVRESTTNRYAENPAAGNELREYHLKHMSTLYPEVPHEGHHWALMVDLNACTGCSSCVIACQSENNTPVIGKDEVRRRRIMHWMRIDRYYTGDEENPGVVFQPLMCQHCDHAPCENVCPVAATTHSQEGINQITYNRCVGTKYCINNCPYKVRRFNWYEYATREKFNSHTTTDLGRMVLNPDVTVRERGVVEKCSFCVQRIQEAKLKAKNERRLLKDGEIRTACMQACPSGALVFGDLNDKNSKVAQLIKDPRNYHLLEELHTLPSVGYLTKIRNPKA
jgi:MoCo/4Fe-4S cofactor protein with predicted Tat translocation signal